jgi:peptidyl-tRNA hydrolase
MSVQIPNSNDTSCLYILMRTDLASLNPGKAMAQASHATSMFEERCKSNSTLKSYADVWRDKHYFGPTVVLGATERQIAEVMDSLDRTDAWKASQLCIDPTYPIKDGSATHHVSLLTCAFVFCKVSLAEKFLCHLSLHP